MLRDYAGPLDLGEQVVRGTGQPPTGNGKADEVPVIFFADGYPGLKVVFAHGVHYWVFRMTKRRRPGRDDIACSGMR
jgi:hypothetical protein